MLRSNVVSANEQLSIAPLHACNIVFEACVLFLCAGSTKEKLGEFFCGDSFAVGSGAIVSLVALLTGEAETSSVALHAVTWYHFLNLMLHLKRLLSNQATVNIFSMDWLSLVTVANFVLFLAAAVLLLQRKLVGKDTASAILSAGVFLASYGSAYESHVARAAIKSLPVLLLAGRTYAIGDSFGRIVALGLLLCSIADFAIEFSFLAGLGVFLCGHLFFLAAFCVDTQTVNVVRGLPLFAYGFMVYTILFPHLGSLRIPVGVYVLIISAMLWRAASLSLNKSWGLHIAFGALSFALSDTLIAVNKFVDPIENVQYPILGLYWLGQGLIAKGAILRLEGSTKAETNDDPDLKKDQ